MASLVDNRYIAHWSSTLLLAVSLLFLNTSHGAGRRGGTHLLELVLLAGSVKSLIIVNSLWIDVLELGLEDLVACSGAGAVGAAAGLHHVVVVVFKLGALTSPFHISYI